MALLDDLLARMRAAPELSDIQVLENEAVDDETFVFKVHALILSHYLQIRFLADRISSATLFNCIVTIRF